MTTHPIPFQPLIQPKDPSGKDTLSGVQKYLLRVIFGWAGKTILHRGRLVEVLEMRAMIRQLSPLMESDLSEGDGPLDAFWVARTSTNRKRFNIERRKNSRRRLTIGICWGDSRPKDARGQRLRSNFPSPEYLRRLIAEMEYDRDAALAAFASPRRFWATTDKKKASNLNMDEQAEQTKNTGYQDIGYGDNLYVPEAPPKHTLTGGGFTQEQVCQGLSRMRADGRVRQALFEIVYKRRSTKGIAAEFDLSVDNLYVYASRLRQHIKADLHGAENLS